MLAFCLCVLLAPHLGCTQQPAGEIAYPKRPIKVIVPFAAGGGSDTFARIIQNAIEQQGLLPQPMVIINVPGAGGTIGSRRVKNARPDGYTVLLLHEGILTAKHSGQASYGPEAFMPIAGTGDATQVIAVGPDSPWANLDELMQAAAEQPDTVVFSANVGAPSQFAGLMLEAEKPGAKFRYTQTGGGAKRFVALKGGHVDVSAFSIAEYHQFKQAGLKALALLGPSRHADFADVPTAIEQGFPVISQNMQFWFCPLGTDPERVAVIADAVCAAMQTPDVAVKLAEMKIDSTTLRGADLADELQLRGDRIATVASVKTQQLPDFAQIVFWSVIGFAILAAWRAHRAGRLGLVTAQTSDNHYARLGLTAILTIAYVAFLQLDLIGFIPATAGYALVLGVTLAWPVLQGDGKSRWQTLTSLAMVAVVMSAGMYALFTKLLVVDLP